MAQKEQQKLLFATRSCPLSHGWRCTKPQRSKCKRGPIRQFSYSKNSSWCKHACLHLRHACLHLLVQKCKLCTINQNLPGTSVRCQDKKMLFCVVFSCVLCCVWCCGVLCCVVLCCVVLCCVVMCCVVHTHAALARVTCSVVLLCVQTCSRMFVVL